MLVTVVIPTFDRAEFIGRALQSVVSQNYRDLEVVVVDDASTDDTPHRVETFRQSDHRIRYLRHEKNRGAQAARNTGIRAAQGEYIALLDSDNEWLPGKLEKQMPLLSQGGRSPGVVYCGYCSVAVDGSTLKEYVPTHRGAIYKQSLRAWLTDTSTLVVQKDILERIQGFDENIPAFQEWDLCIRLARECEFDFVPERLSLYHQHQLPSISRDRLLDAHGYLCVIDKFRSEILQECGRQTLSEHYLRAGRLFMLADRLDLARSCFWKSIRYHPPQLKAMMHWGASLLGRDGYGFLRSGRQGWIG